MELTSLNIKAVLFDLDETLLDRTNSLIKFVTWQANAQLKLDSQTASQFIQRFLILDNSGKVWKDKVYQQLIAEFELAGCTFNELLTTYEQDFCQFVQPNAGVVEVINFLRQKGLKLGLLSNGKSPFQQRNFQALHIAEFFDSIIISEKVGLRKPDPAIFHLALSELNVLPKHALFVGDDLIADVEGATNAGINSVFFNRHQQKNTTQAFATITALHELKYLLG